MIDSLGCGGYVVISTTVNLETWIMGTTDVGWFRTEKTERPFLVIRGCFRGDLARNENIGA